MLQREEIVKGKKVDHQEYIWYSEDKTPLFAQSWSPNSEVQACILLIHDYGEYSSRYSNWANMLCQEDYAVIAFDLRGHGNSSNNTRGIRNYQKLLSDVELFIEKGRELFPNIPSFVYGQGVGGNLICKLAITKPLNINGIIATSPLLEFVDRPNSIAILLAKFAGILFPKLKTNKWLKAEYMSKELREVHLYRSDKTILQTISAKLLLNIIANGQLVKGSMYKINKPILVMHGNADRIASCQATRDFTLNAGSYTTYIEIEEGFHELHMDREQDKVFETIAGWLKNQIDELNA